MDLTDKTVNIKVGKEVKNILVEDVKVGDILQLKGRKIGVDGIIKSGASSIDSSALTGESEPVLLKKEIKFYQEVLTQEISYQLKQQVHLKTLL